MNNQSHKKTLIIIILLIVSNIIWLWVFNVKSNKLQKAEAELATVVQNKKILAFQKMFVEKVLKSNGEVDFNTRVDLQNAVKDINDSEITNIWQGFLSAKTERDGQEKVKSLLSTIASKCYNQ